MAKPIFCIGIPVEDATKDRLDALVLSLERKFKGEYHVIAYTSSNQTDPAFKVLNAGKIEPKAWSAICEDLRKMIKEMGAVELSASHNAVKLILPGR
jgi:hypothetical protein